MPSGVVSAIDTFAPVSSASTSTARAASAAERQPDRDVEPDLAG